MAAERQEDQEDDWCFHCKEGGDLIVCDYKGCLKAYHTNCVGIGEDEPETEDPWICECHSCSDCNKPSDFHCYCCPTAFCKRCLHKVEFVLVNENRGFCNNCVKLTYMGEKNLDVDSDGEKADFKDRDTYEGLFLEYWYIIKAKEGLTSELVYDAHAQMKKGENFLPSSRRDGSGKKNDNDEIYDGIKEDDSEEDVEVARKRKRSKGKKHVKKDAKSNQKEFIGWASKSLLEFLASLGKDPSKELSQYDVSSIMMTYIKENKLLDPDKKSRVLCDERLKSVLGRKSVKKNQIYDILESHLIANLPPPEEDEVWNNSDDEVNNDLGDWKKARILGSAGKSQEKNVTYSASRSCFASIVPANINLVYLRGSVVMELLQQSANFGSMVIGSFVRVKPDTSSNSQRKSYQLAQVTELKQTSDGNDQRETLLQVSAISEGISLKMLSDDIFSEEECNDLRQKVKDGLLKKPTLIELEEKARMLHEAITKHGIKRELAVLQNRIDQANEKGWRRDLYDCMERKRVLESPSEQLRLLQKIPEVIPEEVDVEVMFKNAINENIQDEGKSKRSNIARSVTPSNNLGANKTSSVGKANTDGNSPFRKHSFSSEDDINDNCDGTLGNGNDDATKIKGGRKKADGNSSFRKFSVKPADDGIGNCDDISVNDADMIIKGGREKEDGNSFRKSSFKPADDGNGIWDGTLGNNASMEIKGGREKEEGNSSFRKFSVKPADDGNGNSNGTSGNNDATKIKGGREKADGNSSLINSGPSPGKVRNDSGRAIPGKKAGKKVQEEEEDDEVIELDNEGNAVDQSKGEMGPPMHKSKDEMETLMLKMKEYFCWHCILPTGVKKPPQSLAFLKFWLGEPDVASKCMVWKEGEGEESAITLTEAIRLYWEEEA